MLCEKCNRQEATVHLSEIVAETHQMRKHDFCEACFSQSELAIKFGGKILEPASEPGATVQIWSRHDEPSR